MPHLSEADSAQSPESQTLSTFTDRREQVRPAPVRPRKQSRCLSGEKEGVRYLTADPEHPVVIRQDAYSSLSVVRYRGCRLKVMRALICCPCWRQVITELRVPAVTADRLIRPDMRGNNQECSRTYTPGYAMNRPDLQPNTYVRIRYETTGPAAKHIRQDTL